MCVGGMTAQDGDQAPFPELLVNKCVGTRLSWPSSGWWRGASRGGGCEGKDKAPPQKMMSAPQCHLLSQQEVSLWFPTPALEQGWALLSVSNPLCRLFFCL